ncbi:MAG: dihydrolipoyl dehydrogenase [Polyangiaceae bacterium]|nr:dihydrolipoyl dehydrogenase [Polyangiaceae bacterium]
MTDPAYDAVVLGGGPGGYVCAIRLAQLGMSVACVEAEEVGGVCLNWGCIPSKALISNAHLLLGARGAGERGVVVEQTTVDVERMQVWKDGIVKKLTSGVRQLLKANGATLVRGYGRLVSPNTVAVQEQTGGEQRLLARRAVVVASGSATATVPGFAFDGDRIIGAREAVSLSQIPRRLLVIGGGVIGLELGMVYQAFGSELTVVELTPDLLPGIDPDAVRIVERTIVRRGGKVMKGAAAQSWSLDADGNCVVGVRSGNAVLDIVCDKILVAVGMKPRSSEIGLEELGVRIDRRGFIWTDERCRTSVAGVYAIGDVSGPPMLAHKASKEGEVCAEVIAGHAAAKDWAAIPNVVFTQPEIASVGVSESQARQAGHHVRVGKFPFAALGRAMSLGETEGFVKVVSDAETSRLLGIHICGPSASDLVGEGALALEMVAAAEDLAMTIHPHPTLGEALMEASAAALGHAIHIVNR